MPPDARPPVMVTLAVLSLVVLHAPPSCGGVVVRNWVRTDSFACGTFADSAWAGQFDYHYLQNVLLFDAVNARLLLPTTNYTSRRLLVFSSALDGSKCSVHDVSPASCDFCGMEPSGVIDEINRKALFVSSTGSSDAVPLVARCELNATNCEHFYPATIAGAPVN